MWDPLFLHSLFFVCLFVALGFELSASHLLGRHSYCFRHSTSPFFVVGFFKIGSLKLFAQGYLRTMILLIFAS
jgi:hypothetical protein